MMSDIEATISIDLDQITNKVIGCSDFESSVENAIDNYDFSYMFGNQIEDAINEANLIDKYDVAEHILKAVKEDDDVREEIINMVPAQQQTTTLNHQILEALALCHKTIGQLSQQIALINTMCGASVWPNSTTESLHRLYDILESFGYIFEV